MQADKRTRLLAERVARRCFEKAETEEEQKKLACMPSRYSVRMWRKSKKYIMIEMGENGENS